MTSLTEAVVATHGHLADAGVAHALCGGIAANLYRREVRATTDVDVCVAVGPVEVLSLARGFEGAGFEATPQGAGLVRLHREGWPRIDLLVASTDYERAAVERAASVTLQGREIPVLTAEDLVVFKLAAGRARDYDAVAAMLHAQSLDEDFIVSMLESLDIADRWDLAKREAEGYAD